ncbi:MAG: hydroxysqualene dehydroxylase HpnE [Alphaproteobacteria bacterium]|nr:hydroxysqualene dehydroxylase HpnE [Alphaproteobacteria bacterium]
MTTVHIVGAGLSGLAAAVRLVERGRRVAIYDQADHAGGRCRSYHDSVLDRRIDNGNHLLLSANTAARGFLAVVGAGDSLTGPRRAAFPFVDLAGGMRWEVTFADGPLLGRLPLPPRGIPDVTLAQFMGAWRLRRAGPDATVAGTLDTGSALYRRFWEPLAVAALNTECAQAAARLLWPVVAETVLRGGRYCRPLVARDGLSESFVDPALAWLRARGAGLHLGWRLRGLTFAGERVAALDFAGDRQVAVDGAVVLALPPASAGRVLPGLDPPLETRAIVNGHFRVAAPLPRLPYDSPLIGVLGGTAEWIFLRRDVVSVTVSAADRLAEDEEPAIADRMWRDIRRAIDIDCGNELPVYRVVKEKRATFAHTPSSVRRRPKAQTRWTNLMLAGDWTDTGLPATIEGAIRSGNAAADLLQLGNSTR